MHFIFVTIIYEEIQSIYSIYVNKCRNSINIYYISIYLYLIYVKQNILWK